MKYRFFKGNGGNYSLAVLEGETCVMFITCHYMEGLENIVSIRADIEDGWLDTWDIWEMGGEGLASDPGRAYLETLHNIETGKKIRELSEADIREILNGESRGRKFKDF